VRDTGISDRCGTFVGGQERGAAERRGELVDDMGERLGGGRCHGQEPVVVHGDVLVEGEPALHDVGRAHGGEHRAQGVVDGQDMGDAAAGGERQHGLAGECVLREQVQQSLEDTGVGRLVDGGADDDAVGTCEQVGDLDDRGVPEIRAEQRLGGDGADVEGDHVMALCGQPLVQVAQKSARAGGGGGAAGDGQDGGHGVSFREKARLRGATPNSGTPHSTGVTECGIQA
jgi:hypothetical protein